MHQTLGRSARTADRRPQATIALTRAAEAGDERASQHLRELDEE
ncbi:hypothetical protein [Actinacidiphila yanglinensis]|nr:hypothetical protein [Actinacidiphila yanglinensis]